MKTSSAALAFALSLVAAPVAATSLAGCAQTPEDSASSTGSALSSALSSSVMHAQPGAIAADYHLSNQTFRLFGTQPNADSGGFATFADKSTWATKNVQVGDWLARNYQVASITPAGVTLRSAAGNVTVASGQDFSIAALYHRFDTAASYQGKGSWQVDGATFAQIQAQYGAGATAEDRTGLAPTAMSLAGTVSTVVLTGVDADGVLAHAGLHTGSVLYSLNGAPLHAADLDSVATALTKSGTTVSLVVSDQGAQHTVTYQVN